MINVGRNDHAAGGDLIAYVLRRQLFLLRNVQHLFCYQSFTGIVHLGDIVVSGLGCLVLTAGVPFFSGPGGRCSGISAVLYAHIVTLMSSKLSIIRAGKQVNTVVI